MPETTATPFAFMKDGVFYFSRRVPKDLARHYTSPRIAYSLRTRSAAVATSRALRAAQRLDEHWYHLRISDMELPGKHMLRLGVDGDRPSDGAAAVDDDALKLSEALSIYLQIKGQGRPLNFRRSAERSCGYAIDACGNKAIVGYTKSDATRFRDALVERGLAGSSITRVLGTVRSIVNFAASECGIILTNPFSGIYYDRRAGVADRMLLSLEDIRSIQVLCRDLDDEVRWLVALISDTGMRLGEAAGLLRDDLKLDDPVFLTW